MPVNAVQLNALKDVRATLLGEIAAATEQSRQKLHHAQRGDHSLGSPRAIENAKLRYVAAVEALAEFDRQHGALA